MEVAAVRSLIADMLAENSFVTAKQLEEALQDLRKRTVSEYQLEQTNAAILRESNAREEHERRLARLESDVQAIDAKVAQVLAAMTAFKQDQSDTTEAVKSLRTEIRSLSTVTETLLELSKQRNNAFDHMQVIQETHSEMLTALSTEGALRAEELVRMENAISTLQQSALDTQAAIKALEGRFEALSVTFTSIDTITAIITSKRARSIIITIIALLVSAAFNLDFYTIVESLFRVLTG